MSNSLLKLEDVVFRFIKEGKRNILDHTNLEIKEGGLYLIMGSSGSGKSTLFSVATGLFPENGGFLESGEITICGHRLSSLTPKERAKYVTMMFQNPDLQFCMNTLYDELVFCLENIAVDPREIRERIKEAVSLFSLEDILNQSLSTLSGGEKQMVSLCCLYAMDSRALILDEPFANIDSSSSERILSLLRILKEKGKTIIIVDHRAEKYLDLLDELIIVGEGARVACRGINRDNIASYRDIFLREGLFYPYDNYSKTHSRHSDERAIELERVVIKKDKSKELLLSIDKLSFNKGEITAFVGKSGAGKTTTFLSLLKIHPYNGVIKVFGKRLDKIKKSELYRTMGIVFQNPANQFITQNVLDEVKQSIKLWNNKLSDEELNSKALALLDEYGLLKYKKYSPYMLSQGQQRRLAVLSVLAGGQSILLLDEPTYGQDYRCTCAIMEQLEKQVKERKLTVILITHDEKLAKCYGDKTYKIEEKMVYEA